MKAYLFIPREKLGEYVGAVIKMNGWIKSEVSIMRSNHAVMKVEYLRPQDLFKLGELFALEKPLRTR